MPVIDYKSIPKLMRAGDKAIKYAGVNTLNTIAFDSLPKIVKKGEDDLDFRVNARRALGFRVKKANIHQRVIRAQLSTDRGWLAFHTEAGTRRAKTGFKWKGKDYLIIPRKETQHIAFTKKGRIKAAVYRRMYVAGAKGKDPMLLYRAKGSATAIIIAWLRVEADFKRDLKYEDAVEREFILKANRLLHYYLDQQIRRQSYRR